MHYFHKMELNLRLPRAGICFLAIFLVHQMLNTSFSAELAKIKPLISIKAENAIFKNVLEKIAKDTGYEFLIAEELANMPITVEFMNESLDGAITRLLRGLNYTIIWNEIEKTISISIYGKGVTKWMPISGSSGAQPQPVSGSDLSISGQKTKFDQATSTLEGE